MRELDQLDLTATSISDAGMKSLEGMHNLRFIDLTLTHISDRGIEALARSVPGLVFLRAQQTKVGGIKPFLSFKKLTSLTVSAFQNPQDYARIAELPNLQLFDVHGPGLNDDTLHFFPDSPETFTSLLLQGGDLRGPGLQQLAVLPKLNSLG